MSENEQKFEVPGFQAAGIASGIKEDGRKDLALLYSESPAKAAGVFTTNVFKAAPVLLDMERIKSGTSRAVIINSGNANAATGDEGYQDAVKMARFCAGALQIDEAALHRIDEVPPTLDGVLRRLLALALGARSSRGMPRHRAGARRRLCRPGRRVPRRYAGREGWPRASEN